MTMLHHSVIMKLSIRTMVVVALFCCVAATVKLVASDVRGLITDRKSGDPVSGVTVRLATTRLGAVSDSAGRFVIKNVPKGTHTIEFNRIGYRPTKIVATIRLDQEDVVCTLLPTDLQVQDVIVSANRRVQAVQDVPISVSTVSAADLDQRNITRLDDALRYVSGVTVVKDQVNIRGSSGFALGVGNRAMVLIDGFPLMSGDNGDIKFDVLPVTDIEHIEVIKGAGSALYGTGALGGVVSLFTKKVTEQADMSARVYLGGYTLPRYASWRYSESIPIQGGADVRYAKRFGDVTISASAGIRTDQSYRDFDASTRGVLFAKGTWHMSDVSQLTLFGLYALHVGENFLYWQDLQHATRPPTSQDPDQMLQSEKAASALEWQWIADNHTSVIVRTGLFRTHFENTLNNVTLDSNTSTAYAWNTDVMVTSSLSNAFTLTAGMNGRVNSVSADIYGSQLQTIGSLFAQGEYAFPSGPIVTAGLRVDHEKTASLSPHLEYSPKLGMSWALSPTTAVRASVGRGFRAPAIAERYAKIRYGPFQVRPNPDLLAESSWSYEAGIHWTPADVAIPIDLDLAVFNNELFNLIEPRFDVNDPNVPIVFLNITRARIIGTELTVKSALSKALMFESGLTLMLPRDLVLNQTLKYRNNVLWYSRCIVKPVDPLSLQVEYRFQNRVENIDNSLEAFIPDADQRVPSHVVDVRAFWTFSTQSGAALQLGIIAKNVLDYYYTEAVANLSPTRSIALQIEYR